MSSLSVSNLFDITQSDDAPDLGNCHPDYIQPEFIGAAPSWEYGGARAAPHISQAPRAAITIKITTRKAPRPDLIS